MPRKVFVVDVSHAVGEIQVTGRVDVAAPFYIDMTAADGSGEIKARSLAERIERAIATAVLNFKQDFSE